MPSSRPVYGLRSSAQALPLLVAALLAQSCAISQIGVRATETLLGEEDPELVAEALPAYLKAAEILAATWPKDESFALAAAGMELLYASAFLSPAVDALPDSAWSERAVLVSRVGRLYARGSDRAWTVLERRAKGLRTKLAEGDRSQLARFRPRDVGALYYAAAGSLGGFALDPFDPKRSALLAPAIALLDRALELDPSWDGGSLQVLLVQIAPSLPPELGGGYERADSAYRLALEYSAGTRADVHVAWAKSVCVPRGDVEGFKTACAAALAVDTEFRPAGRLANVLAQREAAALLASVEDIFLLF